MWSSVVSAPNASIVSSTIRCGASAGGQVHGDDVRRAAAPGARRETLGVPSDEHDPRACLRHRLGTGEPDARARARYDGDLPVEAGRSGTASSRPPQPLGLRLVDLERVVEHLASERDAVDLTCPLEADEAREHVVANTLGLPPVRMPVAAAAAQRMPEQLARLEHDLRDRVECLLDAVRARP